MLLPLQAFSVSLSYSRDAKNWHVFLYLIGFTLGIQKRLAGHPSECRLVAALPDLHQRELRPYRSWNWRTHPSVSVSNNFRIFTSLRIVHSQIFLRSIIFQCIHFPLLQCLRTRRAFGRNRLPLRPPLGVLRHLGDGAAKAGACHRHLRPHLGHPDSVVFPALSEVGLK